MNPSLVLPAADSIQVRGARQHNLRNLNVDIPRDRLTVVTGLSGSGKSSLAQMQFSPKASGAKWGACPRSLGNLSKRRVEASPRTMQKMRLSRKVPFTSSCDGCSRWHDRPPNAESTH